MAKVYIANKSTHDYTSAEAYGELINVTEGSVPIFKTSEMKQTIKESLADFTVDDYLLIAGPALLTAMITVELFNRFDTVKYLTFDAKQQEYVVRHLHK